MTTDLDNKLRPIVKDKISEYGMSATLITYSDSYDRASGLTTRTATNTVVTVTPIARIQEEIRVGDEVYIAGGQCLLAAGGLAVTPQRQDELTSGQTWTILKVVPIYSGDLVAAWKLFLYGE